MEATPFLKLVIRARQFLPQDMVDKLLILGERFSAGERGEIAGIIREGIKKSTEHINKSIRSVKKIIREMNAAKESEERSRETLLSFS